MLQAHSFLWNYLWVAPNLFLICLGLLLWKRGFARLFPAFLAFMLLSAVAELAAFLADIIPSVSADNFWRVIWVGLLIEGPLKFLVIGEIFSRVFTPYPSIGRLGKIFHYRAKFLQDWTISADLPQGGEGLWRLDASVAGSGVTGDLLAHCIDTAIWLNGGIQSVAAMTETFIKERKHNLTGKVEKVGIDDACAFLARFKNGSLATFESTRYARGHKALYTFEINGEKASIKWDLHDLHRLEYFDHKDEGKVRGWRSIHVTDGDHPYMGKWWVPGLAIGYDASFTHQVADFIEGIASGKTAQPDFRNAYETQLVLDAILDSAKVRQWREVK